MISTSCRSLRAPASWPAPTTVLERRHLRQRPRARPLSLVGAALTWLLTVAAGLVVVPGCGTEVKPDDVAKSIPTPDTGWRKYFPTELGRNWVYRVKTLGPDGRMRETLVQTRIRAVDGNRVVTNSGDQTVEYEMRPDGVYRPGAQAYMLQEPLHQGHTWSTDVDSPNDDRPRAIVTVTATGATIGTGGMEFTDCVQTVEFIEGVQRATWTYAPRIGVVRMKVEDLTGGDPVTVAEGDMTKTWIEK